MSNIQKRAAFVAFANAFLGLSMLIVAFGLIGPAVLSDRTKFVEMALNHPGPLFFQDILKIASAVVAVYLVLVLSHRLKDGNPKLVLAGTFFGFLAILLLLANGGLSFYSTLQAASLDTDAGNQRNVIIALLGMASIMANGVWYLLENWVARKSGRLPAGLSTLGLVIGAISLVPPFAIFVLLLSIVWSAWLGMVLLKND